MTDRPDGPASGARVVVVGDIMLGDSAIAVGFGARARYQDAAALGAALQPFARICAGADLVVGNLETPLSEHGLDRRSWRSRQMRGCTEYAAVLRDSGFSVLHVANNHATQHGPVAFEETVEALRVVGIDVCGLRGSGPWSAQPVIRTGGEHRIGVLGYCLRPRQFGSETPPYAEGAADSICADVARLRPAVDHVMVSLHWGEEFVDRPSVSEVAMARRVTAAGACLIAGHHPHVVRPVEARAGTVTAFSLGNFLSDMTWDESLRRGLVLDCRLDDRGASVSRLEAVYATRDYRPALDEAWEPRALLEPDVRGLDDSEYARRVRRTVRRVRYAGYRHAFRERRRYATGMLRQLVLNTIRNRIAALLP